MTMKYAILNQANPTWWWSIHDTDWSIVLGGRGYSMYTGQFDTVLDCSSLKRPKNKCGPNFCDKASFLFHKWFRLSSSSLLPDTTTAQGRLMNILVQRKWPRWSNYTLIYSNSSWLLARVTKLKLLSPLSIFMCPRYLAIFWEFQTWHFIQSMGVDYSHLLMLEILFS